MKVTMRKAMGNIASIVTTGSFFAGLPEYGENWEPGKMALLYSQVHSGLKLCSGLVENYLDSSGHITAEGNTAIADVLKCMYKDNWDRAYEAYMAEYNPLENVIEHDDYIESHLGTDSDVLTSGARHEELTSGATKQTQVDGYEGVGGADFADTNKSVIDGDAHTDERDVDTYVDVTEHKYDSEIGHFRTRHGNIGVTRSQEMIRDEMDLRMQWENQFYNMMFEDIDKLLTLSVYANEKETKLITFNDISVNRIDDGVRITIGGSSAIVYDGETPNFTIDSNGDLIASFERG